jgi:phage-related protein (TIGR01555 family)
VKLLNAFSNWYSYLTGQGTAGDHGGAPAVAYRADKTAFEITELLKHAPLMRIACEAMGEDIVRAWRRHEKQIDKWTDLEEQFEMRDTVERALFYGEGYGGAFVIPRYTEAQVKVTDLAKERPVIKKGLLGFEVFAQHQLRPAPNTENLRQPNGLPMFFIIDTLPTVKIHYSWLYAFRGPIRLPSISGSTSTQINLLGQSRVDIIYDDFSRMAAGYNALSHVLVKGNIDILKVKGLAEALARCDTSEEMQDAIHKIVFQTSSTVSGANTFQPMVLDSEESLERKGGNHTGAADIVRELLTLFVAATRIPRTRLLGEQAKGLGNGGEADMASYYDRCASYRERRCTGLLNWMDACIAPSARTKWEYMPLWEMTAQDAAAVEEKKAKAAKDYIDAGVPGMVDAVASDLSERGVYKFAAKQENLDAPID